jgi:acyl-CoA thioesterase I
MFDMRWKGLLLGAVVCVGLLGAVEAELRRAKLYVLGSSTAAGVGASSSAKSWTSLLNAHLIQTRQSGLINWAVPGALTASAVCRDEAAITPKNKQWQAANWAIQAGATHLLLAFPSNDAVAGVSAKDILDQVSSIQQCAQAMNVKVAVLSTLPRAGLQPAQKKVIQTVATELRKKMGLCYIDVYTQLAEPQSSDPARDFSAGDGIHFNDAGHQLIFGAVRHFLDSSTCF